MTVVSRLICRLKSFPTLYSSVRCFSRKYNPIKQTAKHQNNPNSEKLLETFHGSKLLWQVSKQCLFTAAFLGGLYALNAGDEIVENKYCNYGEYGRFSFDVMDDIWGKACEFAECPDTLFNRRIFQVAGLLVAGFLFGAPLYAIRPKLMMLLGSSPSASLVSPITSMFMHGSTLHLLSNVLGLYVLTIGWGSRGPPIQGSLKDMTHQHLISFLVAAGGMTSIICCIRSAVLGLKGTSIGFSGALSALVMYEITKKPESRVAVMFLDPSRYNWSAGDIGKFVIFFELFLLLTSRYHRIDAFGHLTGLGFGYFYCKIGHDELWERMKKHLHPII